MTEHTTAEFDAYERGFEEGRKVILRRSSALDFAIRAAAERGGFFWQDVPEFEHYMETGEIPGQQPPSNEALGTEAMG